MTTKRYHVGGIWAPAVVLEIDGVPPCMYCGVPVDSPSMDGPLVCPTCDMGEKADGSRWTEADRPALKAHAKAYLERYRVAG